MRVRRIWMRTASSFSGVETSDEDCRVTMVVFIRWASFLVPLTSVRLAGDEGVEEGLRGF